jgi:hypothetical protein
VSKANRNRESARAKIARMQALEAQRRRRRNLMAAIGGAVLVIAAAVIVVLVVNGKSNQSNPPPGPRPSLAALSTLGTLKPAPPAGPAGFEGVPIPAAPPLVGTAAAATGGTVDGIRCQTSEQSVYHIHAHVTIFVNGSPMQIPAGVGIPGSRPQTTQNGVVASGGTCLYWLHTHAPDGIIHIESPAQRTYTLGEFFDEWGQPLGSGTVGPASGHVVAIYNGQVFVGNPRDIPLTAHAQIQLEVGTPLIAPEKITFPSGL